MDLHALTSHPEDSEKKPEPVIAIPSVAAPPPPGNENPEPVLIVTQEPSEKMQLPAVIPPPPPPPQVHDVIFWEVHSLVAYYLVLIMFTAWLLLNIWAATS